MIALMLLTGLATAGELPIEVGAYTHGSGGPISKNPWWESFDDPAFTATMEEGLRSNRDLEASWAVVAGVGANSWQGVAPLLPNATFDLGVTLAPTESLGFQFGGLPVGGADPPDTYWNTSAMLNVGMELDWTGRNLLSFSAGRLDHAASKGDGAAQALVISSRIAEAWFDVAAGNEQLAVVQDQLAAQTSLLEAVEIRYASASADALDALQQRQQVATTRALLPEAQAAVTTAEQRLLTFLGRPANETTGGGPSELPPLSPPPALGTPGDLMDTRPDLLAAQRRARAAGVPGTDGREDLGRRLRLVGGVPCVALQEGVGHGRGP